MATPYYQPAFQAMLPPQHSSVDDAIEAFEKLVKHYQQMVELAHGQAYSYNQLNGYYTVPGAGLGSIASSQLGGHFKQVQHLHNQVRLRLQELAGELVALESEPEPEEPVDDEDVRHRLMAITEWLRSKGANGFLLQADGYTANLNAYFDDSLQTGEHVVQHGYHEIQNAAWELAEKAKAQGLGEGRHEHGGYEVIIRKLSQPTNPHAISSWDATVGDLDDEIEKAKAQLAQTMLNQGLMTVDEVKAYVGDPGQPKLEAGFDAAGKLTEISLVDASQSLMPPITVEKVEPKPSKWPPPEYTFGTYVAPTTFLPMSEPVTEKDPGWFKGVESSGFWKDEMLAYSAGYKALTADYLDLTKPADHIYPTYTFAKQGGKSSYANAVASGTQFGVADQLTTADVEKVLADLYSLKVPDWTHQWNWDSAGELSQLKATATVTTFGNVAKPGDTLDVNGEKFTVTHVQTSKIGGLCQFTLTILPLKDAIKKATESMDALADALKVAKPEPWYAKFNQPKKGKKK